MHTPTATRPFVRTALAYAVAAAGCAMGEIVTPLDASGTHHDTGGGMDVPSTTHPDVPITPGTDVPVTPGTDVPVTPVTDVPPTGCTGAADCAGMGGSCCTGVCVDTTSSATSCGVCGHACMTGASCCAGGCVTTQTDVMNCGACAHACGALANATAQCVGGACAVAMCTAGFTDCDMSATNGCETNTSTDASNCGACGHACGAGSTCAGGTCTAVGPSNDHASGATPLAIAATGTTVTGTTTGAGNESTCGAGPDVYYSFTVSVRTILYADTFGTAWDTKLAIATGATGNTTCVDDACTVLQSQLTTVLMPGSYYLVVAGFNAPAFGAFTLHVQSLPVGNGSVNPLLHPPPASMTVSGTTSGTGILAPTTCSLPAAGTGPENTYYFGSCTTATASSVDFLLCMAPGSANYDSVVYIHHGNGAAEACNDDSCGTVQSHLTTTIGAVAGLHAVYVDGYNGAMGTYTMSYTIP